MKNAVDGQRLARSRSLDELKKLNSSHTGEVHTITTLRKEIRGSFLKVLGVLPTQDCVAAKDAANTLTHHVPQI